MTRVEKTQINASAFIILCSTLEKIQSDRVIEPVGNSILIRQKSEQEKEDFTLELTFLKQMFDKLLMGGPGLLIVSGEAEKYLRNCSYACHYYQKENEITGPFDHFRLFHDIHFSDIRTGEDDRAIVNQFCRLFRIPSDICLPFINCSDKSNSKIDLSKSRQQKPFNEIFSTVSMDRISDSFHMVFESEELNMQSSLDSLFAVKDLLFARGIDTSNIPEQNWFSIGRNEEVKYPFISRDGLAVRLTFKYSYLKVEIWKKCK